MSKPSTASLAPSTQSKSEALNDNPSDFSGRGSSEKSSTDNAL